MNQLQIGKDRRVELQIPPSLKRNFKAAEENLRPVGEIHWDVQLSPTGKSQLGHLSNSGSHLNVTSTGQIAH
ncbi:polymorphic toxin type 17 domain-containing protein [Algoriphagus formosus]|uniref:Novel toxin 17 domain-containing protein n=1 Tax=Algoriphagus formosus TaxID=2007308 RepID=A0A4R5VBC2_9BACT|nr:hypothetical protein E1898_02895 [Algoriphagus aquimaris]